MAEAYLEPCQLSQMEFFANIVNEWVSAWVKGRKSVTTFAKISILDVWHGYEYTVEKVDDLSESQVPEMICSWNLYQRYPLKSDNS